MPYPGSYARCTSLKIGLPCPDSFVKALHTHPQRNDDKDGGFSAAGVLSSVRRFHQRGPTKFSINGP